MRFLLIIISFVISFSSDAQSGNRNLWFKRAASVPVGGNTNFSFNEIPYTDVDFINPGRGAEQWHNGSQSISNPSETSDLPSLDLYYRGQWADGGLDGSDPLADGLEGATQGSYTWLTFPSDNWFDNIMRDAIRNGQQVSFGIMPFFSGNGNVNYGGARSAYPQYVHNTMQGASAADRDVVIGGDWMPNWNHSFYLSRLRALHVALNDHILNTSYTPPSGPHAGQSIRYQDVIYCIDIRGFGDYGEWHVAGMAQFDGGFPGNTEPTAATLMELIDLHTEVFQNWPLVMMVAAYNTRRTSDTYGGSYFKVFHQYNQVAHYALDASNNWGRVGYRRDQFGATDGYLHDLLELNTGQWPVGVGLSVAQKFLVLFNSTPGTGEPFPNEVAASGMVELEQQVIMYGSTSFGNGNWGGAFPNPTQRNTIRAAFKRAGYRLKITIGNAPTVINKTVAFSIAASWVNVGVTPAYNGWTVQYELQNTVTSAVVWTGTSSKVLKLFRPDQGTVQTTDVLTVPNSVTAGTYKLVVRVKDPLNYRPDMKLAIQGRNADGSYTIFNSVTVNSII